MYLRIGKNTLSVYLFKLLKLEIHILPKIYCVLYFKLSKRSIVLSWPNDHYSGSL